MAVLPHPRGKRFLPLNPVCAMLPCPQARVGPGLHTSWSRAQGSGYSCMEGLCLHIEPSPALHEYMKAGVSAEKVRSGVMVCCLHSGSPVGPSHAQVIPFSSSESFRPRALSPCPPFLGYFGSFSWLVTVFEQSRPIGQSRPCKALLWHTQA